MADTDKESKELVPAQSKPAALIKPVVTAGELIDHHKTVTEIVKAALEEGRDYGKIPGIDKPILFKAGAERITIAFGCTIEYEVVEREANHDFRFKWRKERYDRRSRRKVVTEGESQGLYRYVVKCTLRHRTSGNVVGEGLGSASTMEAKYIQNPRDLENTVLKMAQKRAFVGVVCNTFGLSDRFTADIEDAEDVEVFTGPQQPQKQLTVGALWKLAQQHGWDEERWKAEVRRLGITRQTTDQVLLGELKDRITNPMPAPQPETEPEPEPQPPEPQEQESESPAPEPAPEPQQQELAPPPASAEDIPDYVTLASEFAEIGGPRGLFHEYCAEIGIKPGDRRTHTKERLQQLATWVRDFSR